MKDLIVTCVAFVYTMFAMGYTVFKYYMWFVQPTSGYLPQINYKEACGLWLCTIFFKQYNLAGKDLTEEENNRMYARLILLPWVLLGIGYLMHIAL
jgi:hypothetical protein